LTDALNAVYASHMPEAAKIATARKQSHFLKRHADAAANLTCLAHHVKADHPAGASGRFEERRQH
jgi:hypothetical protein